MPQPSLGITDDIKSKWTEFRQGMLRYVGLLWRLLFRPRGVILEWMNAPPSQGATQGVPTPSIIAPSTFFFAGLPLWLLLGTFLQNLYYLPPGELGSIELYNNLTRSELGSTKLSPWFVGAASHTLIALITALLLYLALRPLGGRTGFKATLAAMAYAYAGPALTLGTLAWVFCVLLKDCQVCQSAHMTAQSQEVRQAVLEIWGHDLPPPLPTLVPKVALIFYMALMLTALDRTRWWRTVIVTVGVGWFIAPRVVTWLFALLMEYLMPYIWS